MGHLHHEGFSPYTGEFPDLPFLVVVTARFPDAGARTGKTEVDGSDPPLFAARCGRGSVAQFTFAQHPLEGGRSRPNFPCRKARSKNEDRVDLSPQTPQLRQNPGRLTLPPVNLTLVGGGPAPPNPRMRRDTDQPKISPKRDRASSQRASSSVLPPISPAPSRTRAIYSLPCRLHYQAEFRKPDRVLPIARAPDLADHKQSTLALKIPPPPRSAGGAWMASRGLSARGKSPDSSNYRSFRNLTWRWFINASEKPNTSNRAGSTPKSASRADSSRSNGPFSLQ